MAEIEERKVVKQKMLNTKSQGFQYQMQTNYKVKKKVVRKNAKSDDRKFIGDLAKEAETTANHNEWSNVYKITK